MRLVILTTGGTGGHVFPALAVAEELRSRHAGLELLFVGGRHGREAEFAARAGLPFVGLPVRGFLGRGPRAVGAAFGLAWALGISWRLLARRRPDVVVGFGGYAGFAPVAMAALRGVPCALHEQNSRPGSANRLLGRWVDRVFLSFPDEAKFFDAARTRLTGNPVRAAIREAGARAGAGAAPAGRRVLVAGGSLGARAINEAVAGSLEALRARGFSLWHQTGAEDEQTVRAAYACAGWTGEGARVQPFIDDMAAAYAWADVVLCRAGATTVAELAVMGKPSVLVPFPYATHDHQTANARRLEQAGAALLLPQGALGQTDLAQALDALFTEPGRLERMGAAARTLGAPDAAAALADEIEALAARRVA
ncbi:undecaprenyldiphospho-muramoylpentapeptide beta-N-acetylglucosaminyltransferase [Desulfocurvus vexinensis]|uniref:undecaprenyldiphospho-muramoylpentapeptide beta-N-acetylglucosaminyltransferase n=1 Tax=Desulfocurvus vexinensis TaxID=399548 RepID=UPI00048D9110|nr:undecaprenyldiphospho-muramoylpentapeptide beta-N-acetylglucosaminyltransferase [Desulfocurvus vexinensis]